MNDSSIHQDPAIQQSDKPCVVCAEPIKITALKCIKCGAYQDWRRYLEYFQPWVPWVVTAMSIALAVFTYVSQIVHTPDSILELSSPHVFNDEARFIVANAGDRPGVVEQVSVSYRSRTRVESLTIFIPNTRSRPNRWISSNLVSSAHIRSR